MSDALGFISEKEQCKQLGMSLLTLSHFCITHLTESGMLSVSLVIYIPKGHNGMQFPTPVTCYISHSIKIQLKFV